MSESKCCANKDRLHLLRIIVLLDCLTERYWGVATRHLMECLEERNLEISVRQLQRELNFLRRYFLVAPKEGRQGVVRWCWTGQNSLCFEEVCSKTRQVVNLPLDCSLRDPDKTSFLDSSMSKLLRVLTLVELIPVEEDKAWVSIDQLCEGLQARGLGASVRTVQRDIRFIKHHFLIIHRQLPGSK